MRFFLIFLAAFFASGIFSSVLGQDIHFSQYYNTPVPLNPALTGFFKQDFRLNFAYRNQWKQANATFATTAFAGDINLPVGPKGDKVGIGLFLFNDQMGNQIMINNTVYLSGSYIKALDMARRHKISVGLQGGFVQKNLSYDNLYFSNQIIDYQIDQNAPSGEDVNGPAFNYFQVNAGAFYKFRMSAKTDFHAGISFYNINSPKENFMDIDENQLSNRYVVQSGLRNKLTENFYIHPEVLFMFQSQAIDLNVGTMFEYEISKYDATPQLGIWYRTRDAFIFYGGLKFRNYHVGVSYDMTMSSLNDIKQTPSVDDNANIGAFEIVLTYVGFLKRAVPHDQTVPCRFF